MTGSGPHVTRAAHLDGAAVGIAERRLVEHVSKAGAPSWIGQVSNGIHDLHADLLHETGHHRTPVELGELRVQCPRVARLLSMHCSELDRRLEEVRTGRLIRVVLQTDVAVAFCLSVVPGQYIVGIQLGLDPARPHAAIDPANRVMVDLVNTRRSDLGLPSLDPGGLAGRKRLLEAGAPDGAAARLLTTDGEEPLAGVLAKLRDGVSEAEDQNTLHWLVFRRTDVLVPIIDQFEDPDMERHFGLMTVEARRKYYSELTTEAHSIVGKLGRAGRPVLGGPVRSLVLDVEQGAIAIHELGQQEYLVGLTLDQDHVASLEATMATLAEVRTGS